MTKQEAREYLLKQATHLQGQSRSYYGQARRERDDYLDGIRANLSNYKTYMAIAQAYQHQSMVILIALI
jgi:hypothetical protein